MRPAGTVRITAGGQQFAFEPEAVDWRRPRLEPRPSQHPARPVSERIAATAGSSAEDEPSALLASDGTAWLAWQTYADGGDQLWVRRGDGPPEPLTGPNRDLFRVHLAPGAGGAVWAIWSELRRGDWNLFARLWSDNRWGPEQTVVEAAGNDIFHAVAGDGDGRLTLVWQSFRNGRGDIFAKQLSGGRWTPDMRVSESSANDWEPTVAMEGDRAHIAWDGYGDGNYDVYYRLLEGGALGPIERLLTAPSFEARPQLALDPAGRPWLAWEEGDSQWGKDYVNGVEEAGMGLLMRRAVRVARYSTAIATARRPYERLPEEAAHTMTTPRLAFDGNGNPWLLFRFRTNTPRRAKPSYRSMWRLGAVTFSGGGWSELIELPLGYGRIDAATAVAPDGRGGLTSTGAATGARSLGLPRRPGSFQANLSPGPTPPAAADRLEADPGLPVRAPQRGR